MKATIDFDARLYRRLKIEAARRGRTIRDMVDEGVRRVLGLPVGEGAAEPDSLPEWFGSLADYAANAEGAHDLASMRRSVAEKRRIES